MIFLKGCLNVGIRKEAQRRDQDGITSKKHLGGGRGAAEGNNVRRWRSTALVTILIRIDISIGISIGIDIGISIGKRIEGGARLHASRLHATTAARCAGRHAAQ